MVSSLPYKTAFVVNPVGGRGNAQKIWLKTEKILKSASENYKVYFTQAEGDGTSQARQAVKDGAELIVAVGGDGTLREVLNGINLDKNILGIIPAGTGNGFRRSCRIPGNWENALQGLYDWPPRLIDVGDANGSLFINVVGVGFDAAVEQMASGKYHNLRGYLSYIAAFFDELYTFNAFHSNLNCNGVVYDESETLLILAANGSYYGGNMCIAARAEIDDGYLDLMLVKKLKAAETTVLAAQALLKKPLVHQAVIVEKTKQLYIEADHDVPVHLDGEVIGTLPIQITIKPSALKILAPPE